MQYDSFKNDFMSNIYTNQEIRLNMDQVKLILETLDKTSRRYDIFGKTTSMSEMVNDVPSTVYDYINTKRAEGCASGTLYIYRLMLEVFFHSVRKAPEHITADDIRGFLMQYQKTNPVSNRTLDKYRGYICAYFTYLHDYGHIPRNVAKQINPIKYETKHKDILTDYECELLREACKTRRELAMIEFLIATACRIGELVQVKLSDIDWEHNSVLFHGKGNKQGIGFFNARCKIALERYIEERKNYGWDRRCRGSNNQAMQSEYLFIYDRAPFSNLTSRGAEKVIREIVSRVDCIEQNKHITAHRFRASTATNLSSKGMSVFDIQHILRHESPSTTQIYINENKTRLQSEYNKYM